MRVLVADDEKDLRDSIADYLSLDGLEVKTAENGLSALRLMEEESFDVLVLDLKMPGADGLEVLSRLNSLEDHTPVIMISAFGEVSDAVRAMKLGAEDYLVKPFETEELSIKVMKAGEKSRLIQEIARLKDSSSGRFDLTSRNSEMIRLIGLAGKAAPTPAGILITGESGTGKEVMARFIHAESSRKGRPFIPVNLGSIPESLVESELFGYEKGAFTGADRMKTGLFEAAEGGTIFLDEIGDMPIHMQVKLLRALQEKKIQRLGSVRQIQLDVRIIAATNREIEKEVESGSFREDLFYRLNVVRIHLPPLRERREDLPALCGYLISVMNKRMGRSVQGISRVAMDLLRDYSFPGNIRELENLIERAVILSEGNELTASDFSFSFGSGDGKSRTAVPPQGTLKEIERRAVIDALARWEGARSKAAEELGIDRKTLFNKIREYKINGAGE